MSTQEILALADTARAARDAAREAEWDALEAALDARDAACEAFALANDGRSFRALAGAKSGYVAIIVSPSLLTRGAWRLTRFDTRGPCGHTEGMTYAYAIKEAVQWYAVDLARVEF